MTYSEAEELMLELEKLGAAMNSAAAKIEALEGEKERRFLKKAIGNMMADLWIELMRPVVKEHPSLDPDRVNQQEDPGAEP